ncbi:MAG TPA: Gfo/Idh/MocA family oxidoreductase [Beijerinckiaceae bacterium]|nr:Gfo/Idh/MocA family oxidoreductase [Beijerinckiaceae bacterium]
MLKAAIIGLGWWGCTLARALADSEALRPVLGVDPDERARTAGADAGLATGARFEDALSRRDIEAIILCTPHKYHASQIIAAAAAGKHVFCEKPLCVDPTEAEAAFAAVFKAGVQLGVGHERRFEPAMVELRRRFAAGEFGAALVLEGNFSQDKFLALPPDNWRLSATEAPVGPLSATGIHLVDLSIALFGAPFEIWARLSTRATNFANGDTLAITLAFRNGATALLTAILTTPFAGRLAVYGSKGWMEIRDRTHPEQPTGWDVTTSMRNEAPQSRFFPPHAALRDNLEAFARACTCGPPYPITLDEMRANVRAFAAISRSALSGRLVRV